jgi:signal transduction histidine kinase
MAVLGGTGALVTISDRTREVEAQSALRHLADTVEQRVTDRTAELAAANAELEAFSYSVSHDLRAPLRGIEGFSKLLLERHSGQLDDEGRNYLMRVRKATQRMGAITDDLLSLAKVSRTQLDRERVDLSMIANAIAADLAQFEPARVVEWHIAPDLVSVGDPGLLKIALENLIGNAWKYSAKASPARIRFAKTGEDVDQVEFQISDNGAGFDNTYVGQLFNPFRRLHDSNEFAGTGIGLATVRRVIERHGGSVGANGEVGKGATFWFRLRKH